MGLFNDPNDNWKELGEDVLHALAACIGVVVVRWFGPSAAQPALGAVAGGLGLLSWEALQARAMMDPTFGRKRKRSVLAGVIGGAIGGSIPLP